MKISCGVIPFRINENEIEFFLGHPGGKFWEKRNYWTMFKGCRNNGELYKETAIREFEEETGYKMDAKQVGELFLIGCVKQNKHKQVYAYGMNINTINRNECFSNKCEDGITPEIDEYKWIGYVETIKVTHKTHVFFYNKLKKMFEDGEFN